MKAEFWRRAAPPGLCIFLGTHSQECAALLLGYYRSLPPGGWSRPGDGCSLEFGCFGRLFLPVAANVVSQNFWHFFGEDGRPLTFPRSRSIRLRSRRAFGSGRRGDYASLRMTDRFSYMDFRDGAVVTANLKECCCERVAS
jgi:hypothetical protein